MSATFRCPTCNKKLFSYEPRFRKYGRLTNKCKNCGSVYIDPRFHELALEGIPADEFMLRSYIVLIVFGGLMIWRAIYLLGMRQLGLPDEMQWLMPAVIFIVGFILIIGGLVEIIGIKTGLKAKRFEEMLQQSKDRLKDSQYASQLRSFGYNIDIDQ